MGVDLAYFSASDDEDARRAGKRPGGPLGWRVATGTKKVGWFRREPVYTELGPAWDGFATRGYNPVMVEVAGALLRGEDVESVEADERYGQEVELDEGETDTGVFTLTDGLHEAIARAPEDELRALVLRWMATEELRGAGWEEVTEQDHFEFLRGVRGLALRAGATDKRLYCYYRA